MMIIITMIIVMIIITITTIIMIIITTTIIITMITIIMIITTIIMIIIIITTIIIVTTITIIMIITITTIIMMMIIIIIIIITTTIIIKNEYLFSYIWWIIPTPVHLQNRQASKDHQTLNANRPCKKCNGSVHSFFMENTTRILEFIITVDLITCHEWSPQWRWWSIYHSRPYHLSRVITTMTMVIHLSQ